MLLTGGLQSRCNPRRSLEPAAEILGDLVMATQPPDESVMAVLATVLKGALVKTPVITAAGVHNTICKGLFMLALVRAPPDLSEALSKNLSANIREHHRQGPLYAGAGAWPACACAHAWRQGLATPNISPRTARSPQRSRGGWLR